MREVYQNRWDELGLSNDFIFGKVMRNPALCKELLQLILPELDIDHIEYPESQKTFQADTDSKGIRVDVYVKDDASRIYDIEMQVRDTGNFRREAVTIKVPLMWSRLTKVKYIRCWETAILFLYA